MSDRYRANRKRFKRRHGRIAVARADILRPSELIGRDPVLAAEIVMPAFP